MTGVILWGVGLILGLAVLVRSADYFTESAEKIGYSLKIPAFIVGVTIVAIGTSLPELISSLLAVFRGSSEIVVGNVVGSNIANIFLVLGLAGIMNHSLKITRKLESVDLPLLVGSAFFLALTVLDGVFTIFEALLAVGFAGIYVHYAVTSKEQLKDKDIKKELKEELGRPKITKKLLILLLGSALFLYAGALLTIESVVRLSQIFNVGTELIAITAVALGTSLPELVVSVRAALKGNPEIALGNVLGSNIFNSLLVMAIPSFFGVLIIPQSIIEFGLPVMLGATLLFVFMLQDKQITKWEGGMLIVFYLFFLSHTLGIT
jgi:cation:H+ antiporter